MIDNKPNKKYLIVFLKYICSCQSVFLGKLDQNEITSLNQSDRVPIFSCK